MADAEHALERGRESFERQAWADAYADLAAADRDGPLGPEDLERLAVAAYLLGMDGESVEAWSRAHHECLRRDDPERAARCAFWLAFGLLLRGDMAPAGGWFARARRLLDDGQRDCVEHGYLLVPVALQCMFEGDATTAYATSSRAAEIGDRFGDPDLTTIARLGQGQALILLDETAAGVALLDEIMGAVTAARYR